MTSLMLIFSVISLLSVNWNTDVDSVASLLDEGDNIEGSVMTGDHDVNVNVGTNVDVNVNIGVDIDVCCVVAFL